MRLSILPRLTTARSGSIDFRSPPDTPTDKLDTTAAPQHAEYGQELNEELQEELRHHRHLNPQAWLGPRAVPRTSLHPLPTVGRRLELVLVLQGTRH